MKKRIAKLNYTVKTASVILCLIITAVAAMPLAAHAADNGEKVVRVGWYESPFNTTDSFGRRSGYAYEFQQKIAAYTGWKYEYVDGSWSDLFLMLLNGEIDMMSDISYTDERAELILYSSYPMGTEEYYLFVSPDNTEYSTDSYTWLNGKKVGINKGSVMIGMFADWQAKNNTDANVIELTCSEEESINMLHRGELDAYVILDAYGGSSKSVPVVKIGSSDFFFAVQKSRPDLLQELNSAMSSIQDENCFYNQQLYDRYISTSGANVFLNAEERKWLSEHNPIRIGYRDNCLPFCDKDESGKLTGVLKDYLEYASDCFENAHLDFEAVPYHTSEAAIEALNNGEVDCVFPTALSTYDAEIHGLLMTPQTMSAEIYGVVRKADQGILTSKDKIITAVEQNDFNYTSIVKDHFPEWQTEEFSDIRACLGAVKSGKADVALLSNYQYSTLVKLCEQYNLSALPTGEEIEFYIAIASSNKELYSILTRTTSLISTSAVNASLMNYSTDESKISFVEFISDNPLIVIAVAIMIFALITVIIVQNRMIKIKKDAEETLHQVDDLSQKVYIDPLTSVRNKGAFDNYIEELHAQIDREGKSDIAIAIFDCNNLKPINDRYGHDKGDAYIKASANQICRVFKRSPVFRIGGDEFAVIIQKEDFLEREMLKAQFKKNTEETLTTNDNDWEQINLAMGMAVYDPQSDRSLHDTIRRADKNMYENKRLTKMSG